jgi:MFS family permease
MGAQQVSLSAVASRVWEIYRDQAGVLLGVAVILFAVQFVVNLALSAAAAILVALLFWVLSTLYQGMVVELVQDLQDGKRDHSVGDLLRSVGPVLLPLLAVGVLFAIGVGIGFILLIIPGLYLMTIWCVVAPVTVLEHPGVFAAFGRSRELVRGYGWAVFGVILGIFFAVVLVSIIAGLIASGLGSVGRALVQWAVDTAIAPVAALAATVLYLTLRQVHGETVAPREAPAHSPLA